MNQKNFKVKVDGEEDQTCSSTLTADSKIVVKVSSSLLSLNLSVRMITFSDI